MGVDISDILKYIIASIRNISIIYRKLVELQEKTLVGKAVIFVIRFKVYKILYGLSSVKLYQIKLILEKYIMYIQPKKQNLLLSVEDFEYIFPNARQIKSQKYNVIN